MTAWSSKLASPPALYERPENAFVAAFIGENNKLMGKSSRSTGYLQGRAPTMATEYRAQVNVGAAGDRTTLSLRPERVERAGGQRRSDKRLRGRGA